MIMPLKGFIFGKEISPKWFIKLLEKADNVIVVKVSGTIVGVTYTDINGRTKTRAIGERIYSQEFFRNKKELNDYMKEDLKDGY